MNTIGNQPAKRTWSQPTVKVHGTIEQVTGQTIIPKFLNRDDGFALASGQSIGS